jgi:hypothetical protein
LKLRALQGIDLRHAWLVVALMPFACGLAALALDMDANWDLRNYHYYNAYAFLEARHGVDMLVASIPTFFNPLIDVPFYLAAEAWPAKRAGFLLGFVQGLNAVPLFGIASAALGRERFKTLASLALTVLGLTGVGFLSLLGTTFYDNVITLGPLFALWLLMARWSDLSTGGFITAASLAGLAGVLVGLTAGLKLPAAIYAMGLFAGVLAIPAPLKRRALIAATFASGTVAGFAATGGYWIWFLWRTYGNPLFPFYNHIFKSPWALPQDYKHVFYLPEEVWKRILFPIAYAIDPSIAGDVEFEDFRILSIFVLVPLVLLVRLWRRGQPADGAFGQAVPTRIVIVSVVAVYVAWVALFGIYRYALALEMLAPLVVVLSIGLMPGRARLRALAASAVLAAVAASVQTPDWGRVKWTAKWVEVDMSAVDEDALVLLTGHEPLGFLAPSFPRSVRFLRIDGGFTNPRETGVLFNPLMRDIVARHTGMIYALMIPTDRNSAVDNLGAYGLLIDWESCRTVTASIGYMPYELCPARRAAG